MKNVQVRVTLEKPHRGGALLLRHGTEAAVKNPNWDPNRPHLGGQFIAGKPIVYGPLVAGDETKNSTLMPLEAAKDLFGDWDAPETELPGTRLGYVKWVEKERVVRQWGGYKLVKANGTMTPDLTPIGPPDFPHVAIRAVDERGNVDDASVIRPREHFAIDTEVYATSASQQEVNEIDALRQELAEMKRLIERKPARANA